MRAGIVENVQRTKVVHSRKLLRRRHGRHWQGSERRDGQGRSTVGAELRRASRREASRSYRARSRPPPARLSASCDGPRVEHIAAASTVLDSAAYPWHFYECMRLSPHTFSRSAGRLRRARLNICSNRQERKQKVSNRESVCTCPRSRSRSEPRHLQDDQLGGKYFYTSDTATSEFSAFGNSHLRIL